MHLANARNIREADEYAERVLSISTEELMGRAGRAVASLVSEYCRAGGNILILCGKGNNGGDGYATALLLKDDYKITLCDAFNAGQRSSAGKSYLEKCKDSNLSFVGFSELSEYIDSADLIIDAIFGTGFSGELVAELSALGKMVNSSSASVISIDIPLGVSSDSAEVCHGAIRADCTVALFLPKPAHYSLPGAEHCGRVIVDGLGLDDYIEVIDTDYKYTLCDRDFAFAALPVRDKNSNKGSFGRTLHVTGSAQYRGAAHLAMEGALRLGVGYLCHIGEEELGEELRLKFPEALYTDLSVTPHTVSQILDISHKYSTVLIGSGCGVSAALCTLCESLISTDGGPLILDADAINSIAKYSSAKILKTARRTVVLTPHPLELSRLFSIPTEKINSSRIPIAEAIAEEYGIILLLKGWGTIITDGRKTYINSSGSSALAKAGSGDVLAGMISAFTAYSPKTLEAVALCAYLHGRAADNLSDRLSEYGVIPSDIPTEVCHTIASLIKSSKKYF